MEENVELYWLQKRGNTYKVFFPTKKRLRAELRRQKIPAKIRTVERPSKYCYGEYRVTAKVQ